MSRLPSLPGPQYRPCRHCWNRQEVPPHRGGWAPFGSQVLETRETRCLQHPARQCPHSAPWFNFEEMRRCKRLSHVSGGPHMQHKALWKLRPIVYCDLLLGTSWNYIPSNVALFRSATGRSVHPCASILQRNCQRILLSIMIDLNAKRYPAENSWLAKTASSLSAKRPFVVADGLAE